MVIDYIDLVTSFKNLGNATIRMSNRDCAEYGASFTVDNLFWSTGRILQTCDETLRNKIRERLVGLLTLEGYAPTVLKLILDVEMDVNDSPLR